MVSLTYSPDYVNFYLNLVKKDASAMFHPVFRVYKITINVLEQPSHELSIQASVNSKKEGRGGETFENNCYELMRNRRHQTARELKDVNCNVIATFCMSLQ